MPKLKMAIIDGTGSSNDAQYKSDMKDSFCVQLSQKLGPQAAYVRGPCTFGEDVEAEAQWAHDVLMKAFDQDQSTRLMLAGYSRGGSAAIMAAEKIQASHPNAVVDSLFLFDAVARHRFPSGEVIPANVQFSRHARRSQSVKLVLKYEGTINDHWSQRVLGFVGGSSNPMRPSFGNTGLQWRGNGDHQKPTSFAGSHGALGGVGWPFIQEDKLCQEQVAKWMNGHLEQRLTPLGVSAVLEARPPQPGPDARAPTRVLSLNAYAIDLLLMTAHGIDLLSSGRVPDENLTYDPMGMW